MSSPQIIYFVFGVMSTKRTNSQYRLWYKGLSCSSLDGWEKKRYTYGQHSVLSPAFTIDTNIDITQGVIHLNCTSET